jgi:signal transduction histidine kinase
MQIRSLSLNTILAVAFSLIFIFFIITLSFIQYTSIATDKTQDFYDKINKTDSILNHSVTVLFEALNIYDSRYDYEMDIILTELADKYAQSGGDISSLNLTLFKKNGSKVLPVHLDLYIINSSNVIVDTTFETDRGLDFSRYPEFSAILDTIRNGTGFVSDQWVDSFTSPGMYRKYAYLPTSDHQYILEIGIFSDEFWEARRDLFSYDTLGRELIIYNDNLLALTFFNQHGQPVDKIPGRNIGNTTVSQYIEVSELRSSIQDTQLKKRQITYINGSYIIQYQYFAPRENLSPSSFEMSLIAVLVYSKQTLEEELKNIWFLQVVIACIAFVISILFSLFISRYISQPLELIIKDIEEIASGNFMHPIRRTGGSDIDRLGKSIELMVQRILKDVKDIQKSHAETAEELERRRLAEEALIIAHTKLNNLSSITRHDILNQVTCIRGYAFLVERADDKTDVTSYLHEIQRISQLIEDMIKFSRDYHVIGSTHSSWQNLEKVIHEAIMVPFNAQITLSVSVMDVSILADSLLQKVFYNLVDNSLAHGGPDGNKIHIWFEQQGKNGVIIYQDAGSGIPDTEKEQIFSKGFGKGSGLGLFLIREILEITGMSIHENGMQGSGARFEITVPPSQYSFDKNEPSPDNP